MTPHSRLALASPRQLPQCGRRRRRRAYKMISRHATVVYSNGHAHVRLCTFSHCAASCCVDAGGRGATAVKHWGQQTAVFGVIVSKMAANNCAGWTIASHQNEGNDEDASIRPDHMYAICSLSHMGLVAPHIGMMEFRTIVYMRFTSPCPADTISHPDRCINFHDPNCFYVFMPSHSIKCACILLILLLV